MPSKKLDYRDRIFQIDSELAKIQDADLLLERILMEARLMLNADAGTIYVCEGDHLVFKYSQNSTLERRLPPGQKLPYSNARIPIDESRIAGYAAKNRAVLRIDDAYEIPADKPYKFNPSFDKQNGWKTKSILALPLITSSGKLLGIIQVLNALDDSGEVLPFTAQDEKIVGHFASSATDALERAPAYRYAPKAAMRAAKAEASKRVISPAPLTPLTRLLQYSSTVLPMGVIAPRPVITTRLKAF